MTDTDRMRYALMLAERGRGFVEPNPMVGAIVVRDNEIVGEGWHQKFGEAHAEVHALAQAGERARGATLFVTLEPCCHHGKTPPCTEAVIRAGVSRVLVAMVDPFPRVAGGGIAQLRAAGIAVEVDLLEAQARRLNAPYLTLLSKNRPYVHAKWAMTLDGKIATRTGNSKWISGEESRRRVHELRGLMDAIIVGAGTARADDPQLTARPPGPRTALRVVLSHDGRLPMDGHLMRTAREVPVLVAGPRITNADELRRHGCEVFACETVTELMTEFARRRFTNVLIEGGAGVFGSFRDAELIDEVHVFIAPTLIGGTTAVPPMGGLGAEMIGQGLKLTEWAWERRWDDLYVHGII